MKETLKLEDLTSTAIQALAELKLSHFSVKIEKHSRAGLSRYVVESSGELVAKGSWWPDGISMLGLGRNGGLELVKGEEKSFAL